MKKIIAIIILTLSINAFSQELKEKKWILKVNTTQLIDVFSFPTVQLSAEREINSYLSVNTEFGYQLYGSNVQIDTIQLKPKGFKANLEFRCYFKKLFNSRKKSKKNELFIGLQMFYRQNQKSNTIEYKRKDDDINSIYFEDDFGVKKSARGINLTFGSQISLSKTIILEPYLLIGFMDKKIKNIGLEYDEKKHVNNQNDGIPIFVGLDIENKNGEKKINFGFGLRIGYKL